jgi:methylated-DNA-[protein]-cysteine S-methyltransferase
MTESSTYAVFETGMGWVAVLSSKGGLRSTTLPLPTAAAAIGALGLEGRDARLDIPGLAPLTTRLGDYLSGHNVVFPDALCGGGGTPFQQRVWEVTRLIPYGETRTYQWVARQIGHPAAARAVGQALGRNPWPIVVPCHRVVASDGGLGGLGGGLEMKRRLLAMESAASSQLSAQ